MWDKQNRSTGFTIVELLIVIVVIAILAAITIVAYTGIQNRADESALQSNASQAGKKILAVSPQNNDLLPTESTFESATGLSTNTYRYVVSSDQKNFCVSTAKANSSPLLAMAFTSIVGSTQKGLCVRNLITNPSFEQNTSGWSFAGDRGAPTPQRIANGHIGTWSMSVQKDAPVGSAQMNNVFPGLPSQVYSIGFWAWTDTGTCSANVQFARNNNGFSAFTARNLNLTTTPEYFTLTGESPSDTTEIRLRLTVCSNSNVTYYDGFIVTTQPSITSFGDGSQPGWVWEGAPNNSTSFGPVEAIE